MIWVDAAAAEDIPEGARAQFLAGGDRVMVCRVEGRLYAVSAVCPHRGAFLTQGALNGATVRCPWHDWEFDVTTGEGVTNPMSCVRTFGVREEGGRIQIAVEEGDPS